MQHLRFQAVPIRLLSLVLLLALGGCTQLFFVPGRSLVQLPSDRGYAYENVWLKSADGTRLHAWYVQPADEPRGTLYFLHGNAQNISTHINAMWWLVDAGYRVLALDYRGYGRSSGSPDLPEVFDDIAAGTRWLEERKKLEEPVYLFGQSLGASLALRYLADAPDARAFYDGVIVEAAFARYGATARHVASQFFLTWPFQYPVQWFLSDAYDALDGMPALSPLPLLMIHSRDDEIIPFENAELLYAAAGEPKRLMKTTGPHIFGMADERVRNAILAFLKG